MPVRKMSDVAPPKHAELLEQLVAEWRLGETDNPEPLIVIDESPRPDSPIRVFVVWTRWEELSVRDRSRVILDAFRQVEPDEARVSRVTIAWGMTPAEARRAGLDVH